jgi:lauroyl/myristoyl acyltransferase
MHLLVEALVLLLFTILYWTHRERRKILYSRIGRASVSNVWSIARNIAFMVRRRTVQLDDRRSLLKAGLILYSVHYGIWESMPSVLRDRGYATGVLVNRYSEDSSSFLARLSDRFLTRFRTRNNVEVFDRHDSARIVRFLKKGGILGVLVDGNRLYSKMEKIEKLARIARVPLVPFAAYRRNGSGVVRIGCAIDHLVQQYPLDYMWFYRSRSL